MKINETKFSYNSENATDPVFRQPNTYTCSEAISYFVYVDIDTSPKNDIPDITHKEEWIQKTLKGYCETFIHEDLSQNQLRDAHQWTEKKIKEAYLGVELNFSFLVIQVQEDLNEGQGSLFRTTVGCLGPYHLCSFQAGSMMSLFHGNQKTTAPEHNKYAIKTFLFDSSQKLIVIPSELAPHLKISFEKNPSSSTFFNQVNQNLSTCLTWKRIRSNVRAIEFTQEKKMTHPIEEEISPPAYALVPRNNKIIGLCLLSLALVSGTFATKYFSDDSSNLISLSNNPSTPNESMVASIQSDKEALQQAVLYKNEAINDLENQIDQLQSLISQLEDDLNSRINLIQQQETDLSQYRLQAKANSDQVQNLETHITALNSQLEKSSGTIDDLKSDFISLIDTHNTLAEASIEKDESIAQLKSYLDQPDQYWESLLSQREKTIQQLTADLNDLRLDYSKDRENQYLSNAVRKNLGMESASSEDILSTINWMNEQSNTNKKSLISLSDQLERSKETNNNLIDEIYRLNEKIEHASSLTSQVAELESQINQYSINNQQLENDYTTLTSNYQELQAVHTQLCNEKAIQDELLGQDRKLTELLNKEIAYRSDLELQLTQAKSEINQLKAQTLIQQVSPSAPSQSIAQSKPSIQPNSMYNDGYVVQKGDTLTSISLKQYGTTSRWMDLYEANKDTLKDKNRIQVGTKLQLPE